MPGLVKLFGYFQEVCNNLEVSVADIVPVLLGSALEVAVEECGGLLAGLLVPKKFPCLLDYLWVMESCCLEASDVVEVDMIDTVPEVVGEGSKWSPVVLRALERLQYLFECG